MIPRKDSDLVKSGASPEEIMRKFREDQCKACTCPNCSRLRKTNAILCTGFLLLLVLYLVLNLSKSLYREASLETSVQSLVEKRPAQNSLTHLEGRATSSVIPNIIIPAYFGPEDTASWSQVFTQIANYTNTLEFTIVLNPNNGPGSKKEVKRYASTIQALNKCSNAKVLGYVHQSWGTRDITSDVDTWLSYFPQQLDGFFLDEMPSEGTTATLSAVSKNNAYVKTKAASNFRQNTQAMIVQNPGTEVDAAFYKLTYNADVTIVLENTASYLPVWTNLYRASLNADISQLGMILLSINDNALSTTVKSMLQYAKYIFATNLGAAQAYETIASDWGNFVNSAYSYKGTNVVAVTTTAPPVSATKSTKASISRSTRRRFPTPKAKSNSTTRKTRS
ncbi:Spherulin-4 [Dactylellina cionopaga]|nr:Spherulin-4 [Dactylellina cionopaga]